MKIATFGASVTQQKTGYSTRLEKKFNCSVKTFGYGGMHLDNAAICFLDRIIEYRPDVCFLDWFSTSYNDTNDKTIECIETIINKLKQVNCNIVFLFFAFKNSPKKNDFYLFCKKILKNRNIAFIDINESIRKNDIEQILRDDVHTTEYGSKLYSDIIYQQFQIIETSLALPKQLYSTKYMNIKKLEVKKAFDKNLRIYGNCEIIGFLLHIGPHSGIVEVHQDNNSKKYNTWDRWCHYTRPHFNLSQTINGDIVISVLDDDFDTSNCKIKNNFNKVKKQLIIEDIYYIGKSLCVKNISDGYEIKKEPFVVRIFRYAKTLIKAAIN